MAYPAITPSSRKFTAPKWPVTAVVSQSGVSTRRLWGSRPAQAQLTMTYRNITDTEAADIIDYYDDRKGPISKAQLPSQTWTGADAELAKWIKLDEYGAGIDWYFADTPTVDSIFPGVSTVQVKFIGEIRA